MTQLAVGTRLPAMTLSTIQGREVTLPPAGARLVHLQFRRFAGCPVCNLHLRSVAARHGELEAAGVLEVAIFHSSAETMAPFQGDLPFAVVADPQRALYKQFGVESGLKAVVDPRSWGGMLKGSFARHPFSPFRGEGGHLGLPADFLIDATGTIVACKYGEHADDQWSVDEVLALAVPARAVHPE